MTKALLLLLGTLSLLQTPPAPSTPLAGWAWAAGGGLAVAGAGVAFWGVQTGKLPVASGAVAASTVLWALSALAVEFALSESEPR